MSGEEPLEQEETGLLVRALRLPKKGELELLISNKIALAVFSKSPLQEIRHALEAYYLLDPEKREKLFSEEERNEIERLYEVCISLLHAVPTMEGRAAVAWSFPIDRAPVYLYWIRRIWARDNREGEKLKEALRSKNEEERKRVWDNYLVRLASDLSDGTAHLGLVKSVASEFVVYCQPIIAKIMRIIFTNVVSRDTWMETVMIMRGAARREAV